MDTSHPLAGLVDNQEAWAKHIKRAEELSQIFRALAVEGRIRILYLIAHAGELSVSDLTEAMGLSQSSVSHHLKLLSDAGIIGRRQMGTWAYYSIRDSIAGEVAESVTQLLDCGPKNAE